MKIPVIFAADKDYVEQLGVVVTSLLYNAKKDTFYEVYILHNDAREKLEEKVNSVKNLNYNNENFKQANFTYIDMSNNNEIKKFNYHSHAHLQNTRAWAYRLIIAELEELKEWEKVIYLDSDIIIESDLEDLYKIDLEGNALGAVCEYNFLILQSFFWDSTHNQIKYWENILKIPKEKLKYYFNAGVLLVNTKYWRDNNFYEKSLYYINKFLNKNHNYKFLMDQDALNYLCLKDDVKVKPLDISWNYLIHPMLSSNHFIEKSEYYGLLSHLSLIKDVNFKEKIIHYTGEKPWKQLIFKNKLILLYKKKYDEYRKLSGWNQTVKMKKKLINYISNFKSLIRNLIVFKPKITLLFISLSLLINLILISRIIYLIL